MLVQFLPVLRHLERNGTEAWSDENKPCSALTAARQQQKEISTASAHPSAGVTLTSELRDIPAQSDSTRLAASGMGWPRCLVSLRSEWLQGGSHLERGSS